MYDRIFIKLLFRIVSREFDPLNFHYTVYNIVSNFYKIKRKKITNIFYHQYSICCFPRVYLWTAVEPKKFHNPPIVSVVVI